MHSFRYLISARAVSLVSSLARIIIKRSCQKEKGVKRKKKKGGGTTAHRSQQTFPACVPLLRIGSPALGGENQYRTSCVYIYIYKAQHIRLP